MSTLGTVVRYIERIEFTVPADIVGIVFLLTVADALLLFAHPGLGFVQVLVGLPLVLFVPGYIVVSLVFPYRYSTADTEAESGMSSYPHRGLTSGSGPITWRARVILSFGMSLVVIPLLSIVITLLSGAMLRETVLMALNVFVLFGALVCTVQRHNIPKEKRLQLPLREWRHRVRGFFTQRKKVDSFLAVLLVVSMVVAVAMMGFALLAPDNGERYTNVALQTENADGKLVASGYPTEYGPGDTGEMVLSVENHESVETTYTVVVELQRLEVADNSSTVTEEKELMRTQKTVPAGETWTYPHTISPTMTGEDLRLVYLVYKGDAPDDPNMDNAYRYLHLWVSVSDSDESA